MIFRPFASVMARTASRPGTDGTGSSRAAVRVPTARKCEPKLLFIAPSLPIKPEKALTHLKYEVFALLWHPSGGHAKENGYDRKTMQAKKTRRSRGKSLA